MLNESLEIKYLLVRWSGILILRKYNDNLPFEVVFLFNQVLIPFIKFLSHVLFIFFFLQNFNFNNFQLILSRLFLINFFNNLNKLLQTYNIFLISELTQQIHPLFNDNVTLILENWKALLYDTFVIILNFWEPVWIIDNPLDPNKIIQYFFAHLIVTCWVEKYWHMIDVYFTVASFLGTNEPVLNLLRFFFDLCTYFDYLKIAFQKPKA